MKTVFKFGAALSLVIVIGASATTTAFAGMVANCRLYALTAVRQQIENERRQCGFRGNGWSKDLRAHLAWCQSVSPGNWRQMASQRQSDLQQRCRR